MRYHRRRLPMLGSAVVLATTLVLVTVATVAAQSGRRAPRSSTPAPAPTPSPAPTKSPSPEEKSTEPKPALPFFVGIGRTSSFADIPMYFYDTVLRSCVERLDDPASVRVTVANREMNRGEAVKQAKGEADTYVVWLQLRFDNPRSQSADDLREVYIEYVVFAPTTAKIVTSGRTYQQVARAGGVIMMPRPGGQASLPYSEQLLKQAARDAAERILSAMNASGRRVPG